MKNKLLKYTLMSALLVGFIFMAGSVGMAQEQRMPQPNPQQQDKSLVTISGNVKVSDGATLTVVSGDEVEHKITVTKETKIVKAEKAMAATDIKAGDTVMIEVKKGTDGTMTAIAITIQ